MAEGRRAGGWEANTNGRRNTAGRKCFAAFGERLSSLRVRPVGSSMASEACARRCHRRTICGRHRGWIPGQSGCPSVSGRTAGTKAEVQPGTASRENATAGIRTVRDLGAGKTWRRESGDVQLSRLYAHLRKEEGQRNVYGAAANDPQKIAGEAERGESRASATHAYAHS